MPRLREDDYEKPGTMSGFSILGWATKFVFGRCRVKLAERYYLGFGKALRYKPIRGN
jgi:hypothetical protein